jgi:putative membrane protein
MLATATAAAGSSPDVSWTFDPGALVLMALLVALYVPRWLRVRREEGPRGAPAWRLVSFAGGILALFVALVTPVDALGEQLFVMHMTQHLLLLDIAPILLICGLTRMIMRPATRRLQRVEHAAGWFAGPIFAVLFYISAMWVWHIPALYDLALEHPTVHVVEHTFFISAGALYWWHLLSPIPSRARLTGMGPVVYMLSTKLGVGILGIIITFAPDALYAFYDDQPDYWGMTPYVDQQVGGALMAIEQSIIMGVALAWLFVRALGESDKADERAERFGDLAPAAGAEDEGDPLPPEVARRLAEERAQRPSGA